MVCRIAGEHQRLQLSIVGLIIKQLRVMTFSRTLEIIESELTDLRSLYCAGLLFEIGIVVDCFQILCCRVLLSMQESVM